MSRLADRIPQQPLKTRQSRLEAFEQSQILKLIPKSVWEYYQIFEPFHFNVSGKDSPKVNTESGKSLKTLHTERLPNILLRLWTFTIFNLATILH